MYKGYVLTSCTVAISARLQVCRALCYTGPSRGRRAAIQEELGLRFKSVASNIRATSLLRSEVVKLQASRRTEGFEGFRPVVNALFGLAKTRPAGIGDQEENLYLNRPASSSFLLVWGHRTIRGQHWKPHKIGPSVVLIWDSLGCSGSRNQQTARCPDTAAILQMRAWRSERGVGGI